MYRVNAFAQLAGVSVRTLHHYDAIGLLLPAARTSSGHRLYGDAELLRLQQIVLLRHMGLSLGQIQEVLDSPSYDLPTALAEQKLALEAEIARLQTVVNALEQLMTALQALDDPDPVVISVIMRGLTASENDRAQIERFYNPAALTKLSTLQAQFGPEAVAQAAQAWHHVYQRLATLQHRDPSDEAVQSVIAEMHQLVLQFTQGDPDVEAGLRAMYADYEALPTSFQMVDADLHAFSMAAYHIYLDQQGEDE